MEFGFEQKCRILFCLSRGFYELSYLTAGSRMLACNCEAWFMFWCPQVSLCFFVPNLTGYGVWSSTIRLIPYQKRVRSRWCALLQFLLGFLLRKSQWKSVAPFTLVLRWAACQGARIGDTVVFSVGFNKKGEALWGRSTTLLYVGLALRALPVRGCSGMI